MPTYFEDLPVGAKFRFVHGSNTIFTKINDKQNRPSFRVGRRFVHMRKKGWKAEVTTEGCGTVTSKNSTGQ